MKTLILISLLLITAASRGQNSINEVFLIPKGYTGFIYVLFDQPNSTTIPFKKNTRVYDIPKDGILLTNSQPYFNYTNQTFYYIDSLGKRIKIPKQKPGTSIIPPTPVATVFGSTSAYTDIKEKNGAFIYYLKLIISTDAKDQEINSTQYQLDFEKRVSAKIGKQFSTIPNL